MPPKKSSGADGGDTPVGLTDTELRFIKAVFDNMTQKPDADWGKVAGDLGLKDAKCAKERFRQMSVRHGWRDQNAATGTTSRKAKTTTNDGNKVAKKPRAPRKKAKKEESSDTDGVKNEDDDKKDVKMEDLEDEDED